MGSDISQESTYSIPEQGVDTFPFPNALGSDRSTEGGNPSRPSSRLGFNRTMLSPCPSDTMPDSEAIQWSHSLFQNVGIPELRLSSIKAHPQAQTDMVSNAVKELNGNALNDDHLPSSDEHRPDRASSGGTHTDSTRSPAAPLTSPKKSVSRLSFPFVTTHSPRRNKPPTPPPSPPLPPPPSPPPRHKYSCFPSRLSPYSSDKPSKKLERHNYPDHGYSRVALQHLKWFWSMKEHDFSDFRNAKRDESIYEVSANAAVQSLPPLTIHPRRGDISALRDPYCAHIDRCFVGLPSWTLSKTLWMFDLHMATQKRIMDDRASYDDEHSDNESDADVETSASTGCSDDSDATLVESESETDLPSLPTISAHTSKAGSEILHVRRDGTSSSAVCQSIPDIQYDLSKISWLPIVNHNAPVIDHSKPPWPTNWYARWQVLVELSRRNTYRRQAFKAEEASHAPVVAAPKHFPRRNFFIGPDSYGDDNDAWNARFEHIDD